MRVSLTRGPRSVLTALLAANALALEPKAVETFKARFKSDVPRGRRYENTDGIFGLIREAETEAQAREIYREACQEYSGASSGTKRKWERAVEARTAQLRLLRQVETAAVTREASA